MRDDRPAGSDCHQQCGSPIRRIARENIPSSICAASRCAAGRCLCWIPSSLAKAASRSRLLGSRRRKFHDIHVAHPSPTTTEAISASENCTKSRKRFVASRPSIVAAVRQARARPLLDSLQALDRKGAALPIRQERDCSGHPLCAFPLACFARYVDEGGMEIDNSAAERSLRAVALGRKNYLFMGSDEGGSYCPSRYLLIN